MMAERGSPSRAFWRLFYRSERDSTFSADPINSGSRSYPEKTIAVPSAIDICYLYSLSIGSGPYGLPWPGYPGPRAAEGRHPCGASDLDWFTRYDQEYQGRTPFASPTHVHPIGLGRDRCEVCEVSKERYGLTFSRKNRECPDKPRRHRTERTFLESKDRGSAAMIRQFSITRIARSEETRLNSSH